MRRPLVVLSVAIIACGAASDPSTTTGVPTETIEGRILLRQGSEGRGGQPGSCEGRDGYDDIRAGAQVTVKDENGTVIATGRLEGGQQVEVPSATLYICEFGFQVDVPADKSFYAIEVSHRGEITYSRAEMEESAWTVDLELG